MLGLRGHTNKTGGTVSKVDGPATPGIVNAPIGGPIGGCGAIGVGAIGVIPLGPGGPGAENIIIIKYIISYLTLNYKLKISAMALRKD
jgi:hypothetical protein